MKPAERRKVASLTFSRGSSYVRRVLLRARLCEIPIVNVKFV